MVKYGHVISILLFVFTCSSVANVKPKAHKNVTKSGQKRIDVQANKWREAQSAINNLIDESISNEVNKAKKEVKALLEKNIAQHLHEASRRVMEGNIDENEAGDEGSEEQNDSNQDGVCQDQFENCAALAESGVCETSRKAMKQHCERTCELCDDEDELPPATLPSKQSHSDDTWTIIGSDGEKFTTSGIQQGTRKASITTAQVQRLLEYVKKHAPHLQLKKIKPGVLKLIRIPEKKHPKHHPLSLKKHKNGKEKNQDLNHDNYWTMKDDKENEGISAKPKKTAKGPLLHFDLSDLMKDNGDIKGNDDEGLGSMTVSVDTKRKPKSEEYLKHICHPMCKKTCISSCAPGCCAGEHQHDFPLYHRKSSHCHPFCKKHCISSCPLTCCAETEKTFRKWRHPHVHHFTPGCHPMCKKNCVPSCPKACCSREPVKPKSHCHPLCKTNCLSSCPLSCCSHRDRIKEKCHPLCRKTCLPSCPDECCRKQGKKQKMIMKSNPESKPDDDEKTSRDTCPGLCPDSCAPACHTGCCNAEKKKKTHYKPITNVTPSGCTANCVLECLPGCPPACCTKSLPGTSVASTNEQQTSVVQESPVALPFTQPIVTTYAAPPPPQPVLPVYQLEANQPVANTYSQAPKINTVVPHQSQSTSLFAPKHCPSACLTHCSPECARSDCCDLDD